MQYTNECVFAVGNTRLYIPQMDIGKRLDEAMRRAGVETQKQLEEISGVPQPTISRILKNQGKKGPESDTLKRLAAALGVAYVWLSEGLESGDDESEKDLVTTGSYDVQKVGDRRHSVAKDSISYDLPLHRRKDDDVLIPQMLATGGSMGTGVLLRDQPGEIQGWRVTPDWIAKNVKSHTGAANLRIVTGFGDSMRPLYNPGDPLLVDGGVNSVEFDSIYFFRIGNEGFIKRLQRIPGQGMVAISENKSYRDWVITPEMDFEVFARVIKVWCGSDF